MAGELKNVKVLITRQIDLSASLIKQIALLGGSSVCLPLFAIESLLNEELISIVQEKLNNCALAVCVSYNAARLLLAACVCNNVQWATIGVSTANYLMEHGIKQVIFPTNLPYDTDNLMATLKLKSIKLKNQYIILLTGENGDNSLHAQLNNSGANAEIVPIYKRISPQISDQQLKMVFDSSSEIDIMLITCITSLANLMRLAMAAAIDIKSMPLLVVSKRIHMYAVTQGFAKVYSASSMAETDILSALIHLRQKDARII